MNRLDGTQVAVEKHLIELINQLGLGYEGLQVGRNISGDFIAKKTDQGQQVLVAVFEVRVGEFFQRCRKDFGKLGEREDGYKMGPPFRWHVLRAGEPDPVARDTR